ncbi:hypothetical protein [Sphingomonas sp.]|uniref:hypothetical protein n=1 Tax=Sphingomonas sp. TaxID=28214 RepID=UPI003D6D6D80
MSDRDFARTMGGLPDEGLIRIAHAQEEDGYLAEAISAARAELDRRNVSSDDITETVAVAEVERLSGNHRDKDPLSNSQWLCFVIFAPLTLTMFVTLIFLFRGEIRKFKEAWLAIATGYAALCALGVLAFALFAFGVLK